MMGEIPDPALRLFLSGEIEIRRSAQGHQIITDTQVHTVDQRRTSQRNIASNGRYCCHMPLERLRAHRLDIVYSRVSAGAPDHLHSW